MNELIRTTNNDSGEIVVSGRELHVFLEVAERFSKWWERMIGYGFENGIDYTPYQMVHPQNLQTFDDYSMRLDMAKEIAMIQRTNKGKQARQYFLQLERMWNSPEMVIKRAMDFQQQKIMQLETKIEDEKKYTEFGKVVEMSDGAVNIGAFSKIIYDKHKINIGRNKMFEWLRNEGFLIKSGRERNAPLQQYLEQGLFELRPSIIKRTDGDIQSNTTLITGKGQVRITEKLLMDFRGEAK